MPNGHLNFQPIFAVMESNFIGLFLILVNIIGLNQFSLCGHEVFECRPKLPFNDSQIQPNTNTNTKRKAIQFGIRINRFYLSLTITTVPPSLHNSVRRSLSRSLKRFVNYALPVGSSSSRNTQQ